MSISGGVRETGATGVDPSSSHDVSLLCEEVRELRARLARSESGRWWRVHPRQAVLRAVTKLIGSPFPSDFDASDIELCTQVAPYTMTSPERIIALARSAEYVAKHSIPGAIVECGVWKGGSMMVVALTLLRLGVTHRDLYLYDTFAGMPMPGKEDINYLGEIASDVLKRSDRKSNVWAIATLEQVRNAILDLGYPAERIHFVRGLVEETLPEQAPDEIALLRLDTDWYSSTKHELIHLYPRLVRGGLLIIDDYGFWLGARRAVDEYFAEMKTPVFLNRIDESGRLVVKL